MRIALFHNLPSGGAKRAVYEWTRRLASDHLIDVYSLSTADHSFCDIRPLVNNNYIFRFEPNKLFKSPYGRLNQFQRWRDLGELTRIGKNIAQAINQKSYHVVFVNTCQYTFIPSLVSYLDPPSIYYLHEPFGQSLVRKIKRPYIKSDKIANTFNQIDPLIKLYDSRLTKIQKQSITHTDILLANSRFTKESFEREFAGPVSVCHYGVDTVNFYPILTESKSLCVISVGELTPRKGYDFIIESLSLIPTENRPQLIIASNLIDPLEKEYIESLANNMGVQLQILVKLNSKQLNAVYNKSLLCVYAPVKEPFGLVPLEAMACGLPVVGVREGGLQESILHGKTGILEARDPERFARAVEYLLNNPETAVDFGKNGRDHVVSNWTWDQSTICLENHLHR